MFEIASSPPPIAEMTNINSWVPLSFFHNFVIFSNGIQMTLILFPRVSKMIWKTLQSFE